MSETATSSWQVVGRKIFLHTRTSCVVPRAYFITSIPLPTAGLEAGRHHDGGGCTGYFEYPFG
jgi:hypothetical protein